MRGVWGGWSGVEWVGVVESGGRRGEKAKLLAQPLPCFSPRSDMFLDSLFTICPCGAPAQSVVYACGILAFLFGARVVYRSVECAPGVSSGVRYTAKV